MRYLYTLMKREDLKILICPYCHGELEIEVRKEEKEEIVEGLLKCKSCDRKYEIREGIPIML